MIDLRSDTVTRPTPDMLKAMMAAEVGDDVYGEDATINRLEAKVAAYFGMDEAVYVPTGTMANQIAVRMHCSPGTEILCETTSHVVLWEGGAPAALSGVSIQTRNGHHGLLELHHVKDSIRPGDVHSVQTRVLWLENTHNRGGGTIQSLESTRELCEWAKKLDLGRHLDGARIWNAIVATGISGKEWAAHFDTMSVCFSKGLGAPVGSAIVGKRGFMKQARRYRKMMGGAMRQAGYLAAACIYAMDHQIERLADDHRNAKIVAEGISKVPAFRLNPGRIESNIVWFDVDPEWGTGQEVVKRMKAQGILVSALGTQTVRACTHLNVTEAECHQAAAAIATLR